MNNPTVAIIGRMNVGKSTLFNRLTETKRAITSSWAGTTRDTNRAPVIWRGAEFTLVDTGGLDVRQDEQLEQAVINAAMRALEEADLVLFMVDGAAGVLPQDRELAAMVRDSGKPSLLVVNKIDNEKRRKGIDNETYQLNIEPIHFVSSTNGRGTGDLLDDIHERIMAVAIAEEPMLTSVAIVGRPNVGKSSLLNAILGENRVIVADQAHTTRDTNDIVYTYKDRDYLLIDTAGIRKRSRIGKKWEDQRLGQIEKESVQAAIRAMKRADVVLLVLEAQEPITAQDKKIADLADEYGKGLILVINKWDLVEEKDSNTINEYRGYFDAALPFLRWAPIIFVSAAEEQRVKETLDLVMQVGDNYARRVDQEGLQTVLRIVRSAYKPKQTGTRKFRKPSIRFRSLEQVGIRPPRFKLNVNRPKDLPRAIPRIAERELRERFDFEGVKLIIDISSR